MPKLKSLESVGLKNKRVVIREDFNVPMKDGQISNDARILAALPTIKYALAKGAAVILISHLGRPQEGVYDEAYTLTPIAERLSHYLKCPVTLVKDWHHGFAISPGEVALCENIRFSLGESSNDETLSQQLADLGDVYVMDAFACAHRAQASTYGALTKAKTACAGLLLDAEVTALNRALLTIERPFLAIVGGAKVSTKLTVLEALLAKVDHLIVGGGIANTFLAAAGYSVGSSLYEPDLVPLAKKLLSPKILLPSDVVVATELSATAKATTKSLEEIKAEDKILDIGPKTIALYQSYIAKARTLVWNGPVGVFEYPAFAAGTKNLAENIAASSAFSLAGGGETLAAIENYDLNDEISYISTGGGAFLEYLEGKSLPAIELLQQ
ncbi:MAG: phosphoglycerate kinase [Gammaproteobacteria bacterium]|nr:phosphoglycerate kinase [Gammaproteobacteria bacterium]